MATKYYISTYIDGVKHYVRRIRIGKYTVSVTMVTTQIQKALDFGSQCNAANKLSKMGIGYLIEPKLA